MENILDLADNWLMLVRIELDATADNEKAISFYQSFGFEIEGMKKYADLLMMARYNIPTQFK